MSIAKTNISYLSSSITNSPPAPINIINSPPKYITPDSPPDKNTKNNKLWGTLGGLAALGLAACMYYKYRRGSKNMTNSNGKNEPKKILTKLIDSETIKKKLENLGGLKSDVERKVGYLNFDKFKFLDHVKEKINGYIPLDYVFAAKNAKLESCFVPIPDILFVSGANNKTFESLTKLISVKYNADLKTITYRKGDVKPYMSYLSELYSDAESKKSHTFVHIKNIDEFIADLGHANNKEYHSQFESLLEKNKKANITIITDLSTEKANYKANKMVMDCEETINAQDLTSDLEIYEHKTWLNSSAIVKPLRNLQKEETQGMSNILEPKAVFLVNAKNSKIIEFMQKAAKITKSKFVTADLEKSSLEEITAKLENLYKEADFLYDIRGQKTYIFIQNVQELLLNAEKETETYKSLFKLLNEAPEHHSSALIRNNLQNDISSLFNEKNSASFSIVSAKEIAYLQKIKETDGKILEECINLAHIDSDKLCREFIYRILAEQTGYIANGQVPNGILISGDRKKAQKVVESMKKILDINIKESDFDMDDKFKSIKKIVEMAEECEAEYQKTGKRGLVIINNLDELLCDTEIDTSRKAIARLKGFIEHLSEKCHTTILTATDKPLSTLESASIGSQRFALKLHIKTKG